LLTRAEERDLPPLTKVAQARNDVRFVVQALIDPTRDLRTRSSVFHTVVAK